MTTPHRARVLAERGYHFTPSEMLELLDALDAAGARVAALEGALRRYGQHDPYTCAQLGRPDWRCTCGLDAALTTAPGAGGRMMDWSCYVLTASWWALGVLNGMLLMMHLSKPK